MIFTDSSRNIVERMVEAYKLKNIKALSERLGVSLSVVTNRIHRNSTPYDMIVKCSLDTGADLLWLCTGQGEPGIDGVTTVKKIALSDDLLEKLERLNALKEKGGITEQEYNILKANLI